MKEYHFDLDYYLRAKDIIDNRGWLISYETVKTTFLFRVYCRMCHWSIYVDIPMMLYNDDIKCNCREYLS